MALKMATGSLVANFLRENIIRHFGVPKKIISDSGTPFLNKDVCRLTEWYSISQTTSIPYYPKGIGQVEASNKRLLKILGKMTKENEKGWKEELPTSLWAHRTTISQATRTSPFSLVYGIEVVIPIDLVRPVVKLPEIAGIPKEDTLETVEEMCNNIASHNCLYQASIKARHEGQVKERKFQVGELVWKTAPHVQGIARAVKHKFSPKWEGPYIVEEAHATRNYWLKDQAGIKAYSPISGAHLEKYHT